MSRWSWDQDDRWGGWNDRWSPGKHREARSWEEKYTYLNGPHKQAHTVPVEDRISLVRTVVARVQDGDNVLKLPVVKTLQWPADVIDAVMFMFCGIGRKVLWEPVTAQHTA